MSLSALRYEDEFKPHIFDTIFAHLKNLLFFWKSEPVRAVSPHGSLEFVCVVGIRPSAPDAVCALPFPLRSTGCMPAPV